MESKDLEWRPILQDPDREARLLAQLDEETRNDISRVMTGEHAQGAVTAAMVFASTALMSAYFALAPIAFEDKGVAREKIMALKIGVDALLEELLEVLQWRDER